MLEASLNLRVDAPGRKDGAEDLEAADVHALRINICRLAKPNAKAGGGKGRLDWEPCVETPRARLGTPRADSVRIVEHAPV